MTYTQKDVEELIAAAKESGVELSADDAKNALAEMQSELSDDDLRQVSGGYSSDGTTQTLQVGDNVLYNGRIPAVVTKFLGIVSRKEAYIIMFDEERGIMAFQNQLKRV